MRRRVQLEDRKGVVMPLDNAEKQEALRLRRAELGLKEMRGVYVPVKHEKELKDGLRAKVKKILKGN